MTFSACVLNGTARKEYTTTKFEFMYDYVWFFEFLCSYKISAFLLITIHTVLSGVFKYYD